MNNKTSKREWNAYAGFMKGDLVEVPKDLLNGYLSKKDVDKGVILAFNTQKNLALVEFTNLTFLNKKAIPPREEHPKQWFPINRIVKVITKKP